MVVGTEATLHQIDRADVVAFLDADQELLAPRYRAAEQALALLARAARLVGGKAGGGRIVVQTFGPATRWCRRRCTATRGGPPGPSVPAASCCASRRSPPWRRCRGGGPAFVEALQGGLTGIRRAGQGPARPG